MKKMCVLIGAVLICLSSFSEEKVAVQDEKLANITERIIRGFYKECYFDFLPIINDYQNPDSLYDKEMLKKKPDYQYLFNKFYEKGMKKTFEDYEGELYKNSDETIFFEYSYDKVFLLKDYEFKDHKDKYFKYEIIENNPDSIKIFSREMVGKIKGRIPINNRDFNYYDRQTDGHNYPYKYADGSVNIYRDLITYYYYNDKGDLIKRKAEIGYNFGLSNAQMHPYEPVETNLTKGDIFLEENKLKNIVKYSGPEPKYRGTLPTNFYYGIVDEKEY